MCLLTTGACFVQVHCNVFSFFGATCLLNTGCLLNRVATKTGFTVLTKPIYVYRTISYFRVLLPKWWSGDEIVLGKLPVPGRPSNLQVRTGAGWTFFSHLSSLSLSLSLCLWETARYRMQNCL